MAFVRIDHLPVDASESANTGISQGSSVLYLAKHVPYTCGNPLSRILISDVCLHCLFIPIRGLRLHLTGQTQASPSPSNWQPHPSNLGLKITQSLAAASWPWASKNTGEGGDVEGDAVATDSTPSALVAGNISPSERTEFLGKDYDGLGKMNESTGHDHAQGSHHNSDDGGGGGSNNSFLVSAFGGISKIGGVRARSGAMGGGTVVPSLQLEDDDDEGPALVASASDHPESFESPRVNSFSKTKRKPLSGDADGRGDGIGEGSHVGVDSGGVGALVCRRCRGTVEGPLHSTCVCEVRASRCDMHEGEWVIGRPWLTHGVNNIESF